MFSSRLPLILFAAACLPLAAVGAEPNWHAIPGGRYLEVEVPAAVHEGFTLLAPATTGVGFKNPLSPTGAAQNQIRLNGSGVTLGDVDGDGRCDIYLCALEGDNQLYRNLGGWRFEEIGRAAGVSCPDQYSSGATFADVDGDHDLDLLVNTIGRGTRLFLNEGRAEFTASSKAGLVRAYGSTTCALADVDGDGDLDLYVANYRTDTVRSTGFSMLSVGGRKQIMPKDRHRLELTPEGRVLEHGEPDFLYLNEGNGRFKVVSWTGGVFTDEEGKKLGRAPKDWGLCVTFRDLNDDGAPDLYVCNDFHSTDKIWINDGRGRFRPLDPLALRNTATFSMAADFADVNRDGLDDILVSDMMSRQHGRRLMQMAGMDPYSNPIGAFAERQQFDRTVLQLARGDGTYAEVAHYAGLATSEWNWSVLFLDVDLDGYEDLLCSTGHMFDTQDLDAQARIDARGPWRRDTIHEKLLLRPPLKQANLAFRNGRDLTFRECGERWGFNQVGVSQGMALADLDNDGDLDLVVNNLNAPAGLYRNDAGAPRVAVRLRGRAPNTRGIGARVSLHGGAVARQAQEMTCGGRYLSGDDSARVFAARDEASMRIEVWWRNGGRSILEGVRANRIYEIDEAAATDSPRGAINEPHPYFESVAEFSHRHVDEPFDDFSRQPLLPKRLSRLGPGVCWQDLDGDGWEDLAIAGGKGGRMAVYRNLKGERFVARDEPVWSGPVTRPQTALLGWADDRGTIGLLAALSNYRDGLAKGGTVAAYDPSATRLRLLVPSSDAAPGPMATADFDADGDLDLFVGGRVKPGRYPEPASSRLFRNEGGQLILDEDASAVLREIGLVSGAAWSDLNGDGWPDLVLACEWGPIRVFQNDRGRLAEITEELGLADRLGWWNGVTTGDLDGDGRPDLIASNWGLNSRYRASREAPLTLYYGDFDEDGVLDSIEGYRDPLTGLEMPVRDLNSMSIGLAFVQGHFSTHHEYGRATIGDLLNDHPPRAKRLTANTLTSLVFLNRPGRFEARPLPPEAQFAPAFAVCVGDFDGDGNEDVFLSQNFFGYQPKLTRSDAGRGLWLKGDGRGGLEAVPGRVSGIKVYGEQRGAALADYDADGRVDLVVTQNGAGTKLFHNVGAKPGLRVRLAGSPGNPHGVGAVLRLRFGDRLGPAREIHGGSGYWSQDGVVQVLGAPRPPTGLRVRWPGGEVTEFGLPPGATTVGVNREGLVE